MCVCFRWKGDGSMEIKLETASICEVSHRRQNQHTQFLTIEIMPTRHSPMLLRGEWKQRGSLHQEL